MHSENLWLAPGGPGSVARWTSSAKSGVGTSLAPSGKTWFTVSHGILNEIYYPRIDQACTRDFGLIVTDGHQFFSEEKRHAQHEISFLAEGVPALLLRNICNQKKYCIEKEVLSDPQREVVLQRVRFTPLVGTLADYHLFALLAPHLGNSGAGNSAWVGDVKGIPMLLAKHQGKALALACSTHWVKRSAGYVGTSDGWQDLSRHGRMEWTYGRADDGNVALIGEIDLLAAQGEFVLALGFGETFGEAAHRAAASLWDGFERAKTAYLSEWETWQRSITPPKASTAAARHLYRVSTAVLRTHESARFPGGIIASLSLPWGAAQGDGDLGGYHVAWPRDLVESAGGLLAAGAREDVVRALRYLAVTQEADGHWPQNMWLDGTPYWSGLQMDETGFPVLLVDLARREGALDETATKLLWPMVRKAAQFLVRNGPVTPQDRWEEDAGYSPFTLAVEVAALLCAAELAEAFEPAIASYLRETADNWNSAIEQWTYVEDTELSRKAGVSGYYVRIAPVSQHNSLSMMAGLIDIKNRPIDQSSKRADDVVSPDALALVRFGLRAANDPRILNTVKVIDDLLKMETPAGPLWHRYNGDGYGEQEDGGPFDGTGIGRLWPLLTAERAHYELAAGNAEGAQRLADSLSAFAGPGDLLPEQVWDSPDLPDRELFFGKPSGSAMPLVWAHAEYLKLCRSLADGRVFDAPSHVRHRYQVQKKQSTFAFWRFNYKCQTVHRGKGLRIEVLNQALVHFSTDEWKTATDLPTRDSLLGLHFADLPVENLSIGATLVFTFYWHQAQRWEGKDFTVSFVEQTREPAL